MFYSQTLKEQLSTAIDHHGLAEVLDRLAELTYTSGSVNSNQITKLLEDATRLALIQHEATSSDSFVLLNTHQ